MVENLTNFFIYVIIKKKEVWHLYLNFNVLNNEIFETGCDDILMSDWGDEGWKAKKKADGTWKFKEFDKCF